MTQPPSGPIRVAVVEDDADIRAGLELILDGSPGYDCVGVYGSGEDALAALLAEPSPGGTSPIDDRGAAPSGRGQPDVLLMDIELPGISGIETTRKLRAAEHTADILMLTVREDDAALFDSLCAGAVGYLVKTTPPARLIAAIREAHEGGAPMSPTIARRVTRSFQAVRPSPLTERETEILTHLCEGRSYKEIGGALFISEQTVHSHLKNVYRKLEVHSKNEAMAKAMRERWV